MGFCKMVLDSLPEREIIDYVLENHYDVVREAVFEQEVESKNV